MLEPDRAVCGHSMETNKHIFFECVLSAEVWRKICPQVLDILEDHKDDIQSWERVMNVLQERDLVNRGMYTLWMIWNNRNNCVHNFICKRAVFLVLMICRMEQEYRDCSVLPEVNI